MDLSRFWIAALAVMLWGSGFGQTPVTFIFDLNGLEASAEGVHIVGDFNGWNLGAHPMSPLADNPNKYTIELTLDPGLHEYKFVNGLDWAGADAPPTACAMGDCGNRFVEVQPDSEAFTLSYCWGRCASCQLTSVLFRVDMQDEDVNPEGVHVAGDFQGWLGDATPMADADGDGIWEALYSFDVAWLGLTGELHYKFLNGNTWDTAEVLSGECADGNGNRAILIDPSQDFVAGWGYQSSDVSDAPCFNSCQACPEATVVLRADLSAYDTDTIQSVSVGGDFNGWNKTVDLLSPTGEAGIWQIELTLLQYITHSFKFAVNDVYEFAVPDPDCDVLGLFNGVYYNRYLQAGPPGSTIVYSGCFDSCGEPDDLALNCAGECLLDVDNDGVCDALPEVICEDQVACNYGLTGVWLDPCVVALVPGDCAGGAAACGLGMVWNEQAQVCEIVQPMDGNFDGCVGTPDLLMLLSSMGLCAE